MMTRQAWVLVLIIGLLTILGSCAMTPPAFDEDAWRIAVENQRADRIYAAHFKDGAFFNPWMPMESKRFRLFLKWRLSKKAAYTQEEQTFLPHVIPHLKDRIQALPDGDFIAWIGHATFLIRVQGDYWLTDPIFSKRALLPKRVTPPALTAEELYEITDRVNVIITHNHYDHLDKKSLRSLPPSARVIVPAGLKGLVQSFHDGDVLEMDWWERIELGKGTRLVCLPAQHWSRRIGQDFNTTLWASYLLVTPNATIYYGGDSGYFTGYKEIGRKFPGIDYALIPLTAYHPRWFMHYAHMDAAETIRAFQDLQARYYIPTQWGTFQLGDNPPGYPVLDLRRTLHDKNLDPAPFTVMDIGQIRVLSE